MIWQSLGVAIALSAASGVLAGAPTQPSAIPTEVGSPTDVTEAEILQLERERYQRMTVPVTIQGQGPFRFMIDTGAQATVLSHKLAALLQVDNRRPAVLVGMASRMNTETVGIEGLMLGSRSFYIQSAPLVDAEHLGEADGILGLDSLQNQRVLLDFQKNQIVVADAEDLGGNRGFEIIVKARERLGQLIITRSMIDGVQTAVIVDTGAQGSVGNPALLERLRRKRALGETELIDVNGQQLSGLIRIVGELKVGRVQLNNVPVLFADAPPFHVLGLADKPALILGMEELRLFRRVAIDFKSREVLFDLPRGVTPFDSIIGARIGA
jgi:predicted aspartyl protease